MPIGKDSITKRVAKIEPVSPTTETEKIEAPAKAPVKKATTTAKKAPAKKPTTTVIANIAPETVKKVVTTEDNFKKVLIGNDLPYYLL